jgi:hypothetical protein
VTTVLQLAHEGLARLGAALRPDCGIPPPCWMPRELGSRCTRARAGTSAKLTLRIENAGATARGFTVDASGDAADVLIAPPSVTVGPLEAATVEVELPVVASAPRELLVWVRGCHDHVLRWTVEAGAHGTHERHAVHVRDRPDAVHHWYDHFYREHPCPGHGP